jgi:protein XRP2
MARFKAPDGMEFDTKSAYRDYMMEKFFSFKGIQSDLVVKLPGDVDGQVFEISECEDSNLVVMDHVSQLQIDNLKGCRVFIGSCSSSIFVRDCDNCAFYLCCQQLRIRDTTDSVFYTFTPSEIHIELSKGLQFAPFNGSYPNHKKHIEQSGLDTDQTNLWYDIFDHNDPNKTHANWSLLSEDEYGEAWFPEGSPCALAVIPTKAGAVIQQKGEIDGAQVGQSFGIEQMIADAQRLALNNDLPEYTEDFPSANYVSTYEANGTIISSFNSYIQKIL